MTKALKNLKDSEITEFLKSVTDEVGSVCYARAQANSPKKYYTGKLAYVNVVTRTFMKSEKEIKWTNMEISTKYVA